MTMALRTAPYLTRYKVALSVSVVVNLFLIAIVGSRILLAALQPHYANPLDQALATAEESLPPKDAAAFRHVIQTEAPTYSSAAQRLAAARHAVAQQIVVDPYDADAVRRSLESWRTDWNAFFDVFRGTLVDALGAVSAEGRRKLIANHEATRKSMHESGLDP